MTKFVEAEKNLAEMFGWTNLSITEDAVLGRPSEATFLHLPKGEKCAVPAWTRDGRAAFSLMAEHGCYPFMVSSDSESTTVTMSGVGRPFLVHANTPNKEQAIRYAIVLAVTRKLELAISCGEQKALA